MISRGIGRTEKFYGCCFHWFISRGHLKIVVKITRHVLSLNLVKMAASHMAASILMRSSTKMVASHMPAIYCKVNPSGTHTPRKA